MTDRSEQTASNRENIRLIIRHVWDTPYQLFLISGISLFFGEMITHLFLGQVHRHPQPRLTSVIAAGVIACAGIAAVDSAAVAVLLALKRRADEAGAALAFVDAPPALAKLADLYGVDGILET